MIVMSMWQKEVIHTVVQEAFDKVRVKAKAKLH